MSVQQNQKTYWRAVVNNKIPYTFYPGEFHCSDVELSVLLLFFYNPNNYYELNIGGKGFGGLTFPSCLRKKICKII